MYEINYYGAFLKIWARFSLRPHAISLQSQFLETLYRLQETIKVN